MDFTHYVGRVYDHEVLEILTKLQQYAFDDNDPMLRHSLLRIDTRKLKYAKAAYELMRDVEPGSLILFVGTKHWPANSGVGAKTVFGYGLTSRRQRPYCFHRSGNWRHRLRIEGLWWTDREHDGISLEHFAARKRFPPSRFFQDRRGLVERILQRLKSRRDSLAVEQR
jgi:hypothetical protein